MGHYSFMNIFFILVVLVFELWQFSQNVVMKWKEVIRTCCVNMTVYTCLCGSVISEILKRVMVKTVERVMEFTPYSDEEFKGDGKGNHCLTESDSGKETETVEDNTDRIVQSSEDARSMGVRLKDKKNLQQTDRVSKIFKEHPAGNFLGVSRDHCIRQTCTVCPASVSLDNNQGQPGSNRELRRERVRLATFADFPTSAPVSAIRLAQAGFYYTGERDVVKCFSCGKTHQGWQLGDRPTLVHARISPNCALVLGSDTQNIPLPSHVSSLPTFARGGDSDSSVLPLSASAQEQTGSVPSWQNGNHPLGSPSLAPSSAPVSLPPDTGGAGPVTSSAGVSNRATDTAERSLQPMPTRPAVYPLYSQMDARKHSFTSWPGGNGLPTVDELTTLGFFYAGYADCVRCFFCGIGLKSWEEGDIPAEVHARWRPTCEYLRLVKGDEFVDLVACDERNVPAGMGPEGWISQFPAVPDLPVVREAQRRGYSFQDIHQAISRLKDIGLEASIDVMLLGVLSNLSDVPAASVDLQERMCNMRDERDRGGSSVDFTARIRFLLAENAVLQRRQTCRLCNNRNREVLFLPCGHLIVCAICAQEIQPCIHCGARIERKVNAYFA